MAANHFQAREFPAAASDAFAIVMQETGPEFWPLMALVNQYWRRATHASPPCVVARNWYVHGRRNIPALRSIAHTSFVTSCMDGKLAKAQGQHATWAFITEEMRTPPPGGPISCGYIAFESAIINGHLHVAQWLYRTFGCSIEEATNDKHRIFRLACDQGFLETAQWLNATFFFFTPPEFVAGHAGSLILATEYARQAFMLASRNRHEDVAAWLVNTFCMQAI